MEHPWMKDDFQDTFFGILLISLSIVIIAIISRVVPFCPVSGGFICVWREIFKWYLLVLFGVLGFFAPEKQYSETD